MLGYKDIENKQVTKVTRYIPKNPPKSNVPRIDHTCDDLHCRFCLDDTLDCKCICPNKD